MSAATAGGSYTSRSWIAQADRDLEAARLLMAAGHFDWASYAAAQAAEKAIKAMLVAWGADLGGGAKSRPWKIHELGELFHAFRRLPKSQQLTEALTLLPTHDQGARYPDAELDAPPCETYTQAIASKAIELGVAVVDYARRLVPAIDHAVRSLEAAADAAIAEGSVAPP